MSTYFVFGLAGAGKTYFSEWFAEQFDIHFEDADHWLTDEMRVYIKEDKIFTHDMLDRYFAIISDNISALEKKHAHLVISQAAYRDPNRQQLLQAHPNLVFIWVQAQRSIVEARLLERGNEVTLEYARKNESYFEQPQHAVIVINNSRDDDPASLYRQCMQQQTIAGLRAPQGCFHRLFSPAIASIKSFCQRAFGRQSPKP